MSRGLVAVLIVLMIGRVHAEALPDAVRRMLPPGYVELGSASAAFGSHVFFIVALGQPGDNTAPLGARSARPRPLLLFARRPGGDFVRAGQNDAVVLRGTEGGQCDPFLDGGGTITVRGRFFTVENGVACGQHWTDYVTFRFDERRGHYVFDNERVESWSLNASDAPGAPALVRDGRPTVRRGGRNPVSFDHWRQPPEVERGRQQDDH